MPENTPTGQNQVYQLIGELALLSRNMHAQATQGNWDALLQEESRRREGLARLNALLGPQGNQGDRLSPEARQVLDHMVRLDEETQKLVLAQRNDLERRLNSINNTHSLAKAYHSF